jgi:hypothetical protein
MEESGSWKICLMLEEGGREESKQVKSKDEVFQHLVRNTVVTSSMALGSPIKRFVPESRSFSCLCHFLIYTKKRIVDEVQCSFQSPGTHSLQFFPRLKKYVPLLSYFGANKHHGWTPQRRDIFCPAE